MEKFQKELHEAQVNAALRIIEVLNKSNIDIELLNALSSLLKEMHHDPKVRTEVEKLSITLLAYCEKELDPQLITATANLMKCQV